MAQDVIKVAHSILHEKEKHELDQVDDASVELIRSEKPAGLGQADPMNTVGKQDLSINEDGDGN